MEINIKIKCSPEEFKSIFSKNENNIVGNILTEEQLKSFYATQNFDGTPVEQGEKIQKTYNELAQEYEKLKSQVF